MTRTYTLQDLQYLSLSALHTLRGVLQRELALAPPHSREARETLTSLDAVNHVIRQRSPGPRMG
jgi:hypothetical protein